MICPQCKHEFLFSDIPLDDRKYKAWSCNFKCPACRSWLSPSKRKRTFLNLGVAGVAIAGFSMALEVQITETFNSRLLGVILVPSVICMLISSRDKTANLLKK